MSDRLRTEAVADTLASLPSYTEVTFHLWRGTSHTGLARDLPRATSAEPGRRYTVDGSEWFITPKALENLGVTSVTVHTFDLTL